MCGARRNHYSLTVNVLFLAEGPCRPAFKHVVVTETQTRRVGVIQVDESVRKIVVRISDTGITVWMGAHIAFVLNMRLLECVDVYMRARVSVCVL